MRGYLYPAGVHFRKMLNGIPGREKGECIQARKSEYPISPQVFPEQDSQRHSGYFRILRDCRVYLLFHGVNELISIPFY